MSADGLRPSLGQLTWFGKRLKEALDAGEPPPPAGVLRRDLQRWINTDSDVTRLPAVQEVLGRLLYEDLESAEWPEVLGQVIEQMREVYRQLRRPHPLDTLLMDVDWLWLTDRPALRALGLLTVGDLLQHYPRRYEDATTYTAIGALEVGAKKACVRGIVQGVKEVKVRKNGKPPYLQVLVRDETGDLRVQIHRYSNHHVRWFWVGRQVVLRGDVVGNPGYLMMNNPTYEAFEQEEASLHVGRLLPIHPLTAGLSGWRMREIMNCALDQFCPVISDPLPDAVRSTHRLMPLAEAVRQIHYPDSEERRAIAEWRLGFDEVLIIQLGIQRRKREWQQQAGQAMPTEDAHHQALLQALPFQLTGAQERAIADIRADMARLAPMARLVQGDVGSGKTVVAAAAVVQAIANGYQAALMAPTEILAEQHYKSLRSLLSALPIQRYRPQASEEAPAEELSEEKQRLFALIDEICARLGLDEAERERPIRVERLTGSMAARDRRLVLEGLARGQVDLVVGTHALISECVAYAHLGLVVVDEQHRFGVEQRRRLSAKGVQPHLLMLTATPIPRTLTMAIHGDLDVSILDELPPGRTPIRTTWLKREERERAYEHIEAELAAGRQAFVICPLIDESETVDWPSVQEMHQTLAKEVFPHRRVQLLHGQLQPRTKDEVMVAFRNHDYDILVATAVVEVGIDVPNATTILIEGADRFGLSQLHQLRGRVGRGAHASVCYLVSDAESEDAQVRLRTMERTTDGFALAEEDLKARGPGSFFGQRQSGAPDVRVGRWVNLQLVKQAQECAATLLVDDPELASEELRALRGLVERRWTDAQPER